MKKIILLLQRSAFAPLLFCLIAPALLSGQTLHDVVTVGSSFSPANLTIQVGDMVRWTNSGMGFHNVRADDDSFRCADGCDGLGGDGDPAGNAWTFTLTFSSADVIGYYCEIHGGTGGSGMSGVITVQAAATPSCTNLTNPANGATNVPANTTLTWAPASGAPTGYRLDVGTTPGGTDILNNFDAGNVLTYDPPGYFPYGGTIYVTVKPYNATGSAAACTEQNFATGNCIPNLTIVSIPVPVGTHKSLGDLLSHTSTVANGTVVTFTSDTGVLLNGEFVVETGGVFEVNIVGCGN